jgi:quinoprotein dehydrogenase-associated probable ABC transporter substrate-binding protein
MRGEWKAPNELKARARARAAAPLAALMAGILGLTMAVLCARQGLAQGAAGQPGAGQGSSQLSIELIDPKVFRSCSDPHNMPFSTDKGEGFENKIAELFAAKLGKSLDYTWYPNSTGFVRNTLGSYKCDVIMGMPQGNDLVQVTNPYYRTAYAFVTKPGGGLDDVDNLEDPRLKGKRIGIVAGTPPATNMAINGLMMTAKPYPLVVDTRVDSSAAAMMDDLVKGEIDAGVLWGPMAGYFATKAGTPVGVKPLVKEKTGPSLIYYIGMGVRPNDQEWKRVLNGLIKDTKGEIERTLLSYGVPLLDADNRPVTGEGAPGQP